MAMGTSLSPANSLIMMTQRIPKPLFTLRLGSERLLQYCPVFVITYGSSMTWTHEHRPRWSGISLLSMKRSLGYWRTAENLHEVRHLSHYQELQVDECITDMLSSFITPTSDVLEHVLREFVKPVFQSNPHPLLNPETGRKLPRPAGGPLGHLDYLEGQGWKTRPSLSSVLSWCLSHTDVGEECAHLATR